MRHYRDTHTHTREASPTYTCFEPSAIRCAHALTSFPSFPHSPPHPPPSRECCARFFYIFLSMLRRAHECTCMCVWSFSSPHVCFSFGVVVRRLSVHSLHLPSALPVPIPFLSLSLLLTNLISISGAPRCARETHPKLEDVWTTWPPCSPLSFLCVFL